MDDKIDEARYALRAITSCNGEAIVLRNMALSDGGRRRLLVSSSQRRMIEYRRDHPESNYIFCYSIDQGRGIDTRTPVVMLDPVNSELKDFIEKSFTNIIPYDKM